MILDPRVDFEVNFQVARRAEELWALLAGEGLLLRVSSRVKIQVRHLSELFLANLALVSFIVGVGSKMQFHVSLVMENFSTLKALLGLDESGNFFLPLLLEDLDL